MGSYVFLDMEEGEHGEERWRPRTLCLDLDPSTLDNVRASTMGALFKPDNLLCGQNSSRGCFGVAHYTEGFELIEPAMDRFRQEMEACDCPTGAQFLHSMAGGTGSGLTSYLQIKITDEYVGFCNQSHSLLPTDEVSHNVVEPYNAIMALHLLFDHVDLATLYENQAVHRILEKLCGNNNSSFAEVNKVIAQSIANVSASIRLPSTRNCQLRKTLVNLISFPRLHFVVPSLAPFQADKRAALTVDSITRATLTYDHFLADINPERGTYWGGYFAYRGAGISTGEVDYALRDIDTIYGSQYPLFDSKDHHFVSSVCNRSPLDAEMSCTHLANTSATRHIFERMCQKFHALYRRKAFLKTFLDTGMDEMEFQEADKNVRDYIVECVPWNNTTFYECVIMRMIA